MSRQRHHRQRETASSWDEPTASSASFTPPSGFWSSFTDVMDRPTVIRGLLEAPLLGRAEVLTIVHKALEPFVGDDCSHRGASDARFRLYADGRLVEGTHIWRCLPALSSSDALVDYLSGRLGASTFGLVLIDLPEVHRPLWFRCRDFVQGLLDRVGVPASHLHCQLFCGTYERTPFGIHRDDSSNFVFCLEGTKEIWVWPRSYFDDADVPRVAEFVLADPARFEADAVRLCMRPGDVAFWPSSYWHVGMSEGGRFHASVTLGMWEVRDVAREVSTSVERALRGRMGPTASTVTGFVRSPDELSPPNALVDLGPLQDVLDDQRLRQVSAGGFLSRPGATTHPPVSSYRWLRGRYPMRMRRLGGRTWLYVNGYRIALRDAAARECADLLETRTWLGMTETQEQFGVETVHKLLQPLANIGALALR